MAHGLHNLRDSSPWDQPPGSPTYQQLLIFCNHSDSRALRMTLICDACRGALEEHRNSSIHNSNSIHYLHHWTIAALATAAANGCPFCSAFWAQYSRMEQECLLEDDEWDVASSSNLREHCVTTLVVQPAHVALRRVDLGLFESLVVVMFLEPKNVLPPAALNKSLLHFGKRNHLAFFLLKPALDDGMPRYTVVVYLHGADSAPQTK